MLPLSDESQPGLKPAAASVLVLRLGSGRLGIGFGTAHSASQVNTKDHFASDPVLRLSVAFPQSGETRIYSVGLVDGYTAGLVDGYTPGLEDRRTGERLLAFSLDVLAPFEFSGLAYDPLGSIAASVARLAAPAAGKSGDVSGRSVDRLGSPAERLGSPAERPGSPGRPGDCMMALWAALESDLYRFAKDRGFTAAVDAAATGQPEEYRRFARLNNLYREMVKLLVPYGQAPQRWSAWLRGQDYRPVLPVGLALGIQKFLEGRNGQPERAMESLTTLLVEYGALAMKPRP